MDILGIPGVSADAELIAAVVDMMRDLGFTSEDFSVRISSRTLLEGLFLHAGVTPDKLGLLYGLLDKKHKITPEEFSAELASIVENPAQAQCIGAILNVQTLGEASALCPDLAALKDLTGLFSLLSTYGISDFVSFDIGIVRGLAYYTGIVFEVFDKMRTLRAVAGGGRYDRLVKMYGGPDTPAVGFAAGDVVLGEMLKGKPDQPALPCRSEVFIVSLDGNIEKSIDLARVLRAAGISCEFSLKTAGVGKQMESAHAARSARVVFIGGTEEIEGNVKVKNMKTGEEKMLKKTELIAYIAL
jgi:histidyl-tRNA synthetase